VRLEVILSEARLRAESKKLARSSARNNSLLITGEYAMAKLTAHTAKAMALELYGYELTDEAAEAVANAAGAMITRSRRLGNLDLSGVQPPFGYPTLLAEAERIRKRG
jgi:hypothetical protein